MQVIGDGEITDSRGSRVDAQGSPGLIRLQEQRWQSYFGLGTDIYYLIFHEMLRCSGVSDDSYVISLKINPFPLLTSKPPMGNWAACPLASVLVQQFSLVWVVHPMTQFKEREIIYFEYLR